MREASDVRGEHASRSEHAILLEARDVSKYFGALRAVDGVHIQVNAGEIVGFIGPNGAGKTTLFNCITGFLRKDSGSIRFRGKEIGGLPPRRIAEQGLVRTFQTPVGFPRMTVWENLACVPAGQAGEGFWRGLLGGAAVEEQEQRILHQAGEILDRFSLWARRNDPVETLSAPELKILEMARALMLEPSLLLLDEPASGVSPHLIQRISEWIRELCRRGQTFLIIDHNLGFILELADRVYVMAGGRVIAEGTPAEIRRDEKVQEVYLGVGA